MSTANLPAVRGEVMPTLDERVARLKVLFAEADRHATFWLETVMAIGDGLNEARHLVPREEWVTWLRVNFDKHPEVARRYMRFAKYRELIPTDTTSQKAALAYVHGLPPVDEEQPGRSQLEHELTKYARKRRSEGATYAAIAEEVDRSERAVWNWCNRAKTRDWQRRRRSVLRQQREALERELRDRAARKMGGSVAQAYSLLRRLAQELERAANEDEDAERRKALNAAYRSLRIVEDQIVAALGKA